MPKNAFLWHETQNNDHFAQSLSELRKSNPELDWRIRASHAPDDSSAVLWENVHFNSCLRLKEFAIIKQLVAKHGIQKNFDALDGGCGTGDISRFLVDLGFKRIDAIDFPEMVALARRRNPHRRIRYIASSAQSHCVKKEYGLVVNSGAFSQMGRYLFTAIDNSITMLRQGGHILMIDPFHKYIHVRTNRVSAEEVAEYVKCKGLRLIENSGMVFWPFGMSLRGNLRLTGYQTRIVFETGERIMTRLGDRCWSDYKVLLFKKG
jgi:SAM-dependent methyltransferase